MPNETLLIVEDDLALRNGLREMLSLEGFTVLTASNGREALQQMSAVSPDLILSDIAMPEMDGYTFLKRVRARGDWLTIPFIFLTARNDITDVLVGKNLGVEDYLIKPLSREELVTAVRSRLTRSQQVQMAQRQQAFEASLTVLANAIDLRDRYTRWHVQRVTAYSLALATLLGWQEKRLEHLRYGAILHDIGKIHISEAILLKPARLTPEEWDEIRTHPVKGAEMLKDIPYLEPATPTIRYHHERWDGQGYPDGLQGEGIPMGARIVAVADGFDAMTSHRPYSQARTLSEARLEIDHCSGSQYDPSVVAAFQRAWNLGQIQAIYANWEGEGK